MKPAKFLIFAIISIVIFNQQASAQDSIAVVVRALAKDAKFIGSSMGGAMITIVVNSTGDTLAQGLTQGSTGDTERLVQEPVQRYEKLSTPGAAKFEANLSLKEPTFVIISATGPKSYPGSEVTVTTQQWLIPGQDISGDGIILEMPGFVVTNQLPKQGETYSAGQPVPIKSHIVMMCGCPTSDGGLWDSSEYALRAQIKKDGDLVKTVPLRFTGETNLFDTEFLPEEPGEYHILVYAFHPETGNSGVATSKVTIK